MHKVMIVDNEAALRKGLIHCIRWESLDCIIAGQAEDGIDALEQIPVVKPDILISDIKMPGMDGLELSKEVKERYPHIKVIILTGFPDFEYAQMAISYQVIDFVLKPTTVESLVSAIEKAKAHIVSEKIGMELKQELATKEEQNLALQRGIFLRDLIRGVELSQLYILNRSAQLKLDLTGYYLLRLDIAPLYENTPDLTAEEEEHLLLYLQQAQTILTDCLIDCTAHFVPFGDQICYAVVEAPSSYPIVSHCKETISILNSLPQFFLSIGVSSYCDTPLRMPQAAEQTFQASQFAKYFPEMPVIDVTQIPEIPKQVRERIFTDLRYLKSSIENQNTASTHTILNKLFTFIRENKLPVDTVHNICLYIHQFCINLLFLPDTDEYMSENSVPALKKIIESTSIDSLEQNMRSFVEQMLSQTAPADAEADQVIHAIKNYISKNLAADLTLDTMARQVYLSPSYLSRLFKRETGENLSTYVQNIRIEEAKTLLLTTTLKTYEVAEKVGIPDPVYFSRIFKKVTGIKPKDYRQQTEH